MIEPGSCPAADCEKIMMLIALIIRLHGQAVKTSPFHGGNTGSIPVGVIMDL